MMEGPLPLYSHSITILILIESNSLFKGSMLYYSKYGKLPSCRHYDRFGLQIHLSLLTELVPIDSPASFEFNKITDQNYIV